MTVARRKLISLEVTPWYHCTSRCVRRSYLFGKDKLTQRSFDHRKGWIEKLLLELTEVFCIDVAAYAVMSNHYHVVVRVDTKLAASLSDIEVAKRLKKIYRGSPLIQRLIRGDTFSNSENKQLKEDLRKWRNLLTDIGRFMGHINQTVARRANKEDDCTGRFWQGRFSSQAILDTASLLRTLCYVDLNPVRAKKSNSATQSSYTSITRRLNCSDKRLVPFCETSQEAHGPLEDREVLNSIPITLSTYCRLLEWTARGLKQETKSSGTTGMPDSLQNLGYSSEGWMLAMQKNKGWRQKALGSVKRIQEYATSIGQSWIWVKT